MEKPFELKALGQKIIENAKQNGLPLAEEASEALARSAYFGVKEWLSESAAMTKTPIDDVIMKFSDHADSFVLEQIRKIDLDKDGK